MVGGRERGGRSQRRRRGRCLRDKRGGEGRKGERDGRGDMVSGCKKRKGMEMRGMKQSGGVLCLHWLRDAIVS